MERSDSTIRHSSFDIIHSKGGFFELGCGFAEYRYHEISIKVSGFGCQVSGIMCVISDALRWHYGVPTGAGFRTLRGSA